jgi:hypothetical protein
MTKSFWIDPDNGKNMGLGRFILMLVRNLNGVLPQTKNYTLHPETGKPYL